ncbi:hypothetical protein Pse7367_2536 [Thalassoporum mexicanum PCC 7367]|nr:TIGR00725 family protein [Pseudanabaena sp. PCC 7367]AFY70796.1 hypothetical protein Pse7367_2536 [Pseudanabaena sp. PCC 7367]
MAIGIMGPGLGARPQDLSCAFELGRLVAQNGWVLLTGGREMGVMEAASKGAKSADGLTIGILPGDSTIGCSDFVDVAIVTGMGSARNNINVLSSDVVIACGMGAGTVSEIALAIKANKPVILVNATDSAIAFFQSLVPSNITIATNAQEAINQAKLLVNSLS